MDGFVSPHQEHGPLSDVHTVDGVLVGIDFGTSFSSVAYAREPKRAGDRPPRMTSCLFGASENTAQVPSQMAFDNTAQSWAFGYEVDEALRYGGVDRDNIFAMLKLAFDTSPSNSEIASRHARQIDALPQEAKEKLGRISDMRELVLLFLQWLWGQAMGAIKGVYQDLHGLNDIHQKVKCRFALPAHWGPSLVGQLANVVRDAGIENVEYVSEPEAAAGFIIRENWLQVRSQQGRLENWILKVLVLSDDRL